MTDHQLQELLLKAEIPVPEGAWTQINTVLEEDALDTEYQHQLHTFTIPPAENVWTAIEEELNWKQQDEAISASLLDQKLEPPAFIWENVETSLAKGSDSLLAEKLAAAELEAPERVWPAIEDTLHPKAKVISINKRIAAIYRYAAAAVIVGLMAWGAFQILNQPEEVTAITGSKPTIKSIITTNDTNAQPKSVAVTKSTVKTSEVSKDLMAFQQPKKVSLRKSTIDEVMSHENPAVQSTDFSETNYLLVVDDKGDLIRVSKKLSTMDCVKNSNMPVDAVTALQVKDCEDKIKRLQQKLATSVLGDIVDPNTLNAETEK
ncbi:MAG TPA: hypothetical protein VFV46_04475 [Lacibacter sp.]|nr:hypothetical protein [Lacibacter sp.]